MAELWFDLKTYAQIWARVPFWLNMNIFERNQHHLICIIKLNVLCAL